MSSTVWESFSDACRGGYSRLVVAAIAVDGEVTPRRHSIPGGPGELVRAGLECWVDDARRYLEDRAPAGGQERCYQAWWLICCQPDGSPLVELAASLCGVEPAVVWQRLWDRLYGQ